MKDIRKTIETCEIPHTRFQELYCHLKGSIEDALDGHDPQIEVLVGPSRVGKTILLRALERDFPKTTVDGKKHVPVLFVPLDPGVSPKLLPTNVLVALDAPIPKKKLSVIDMNQLMQRQLQLAGTKVILLEEASHLVEESSRMHPQEASDWVKYTSDMLRLTMVLTGVPRLNRLIQGSQQLNLRATDSLEFRPYNSSSQSDMMSYASCVGSYLKIFGEAGFQCEVPLESVVKNSYLVSAGLLGVLSKLMINLCKFIEREPRPRPLTLADFQAAAQRTRTAGNPLCQPFQRMEVPAMEMFQCHAYALEEAGLTAKYSGALL